MAVAMCCHFLYEKTTLLCFIKKIHYIFTITTNALTDKLVAAYTHKISQIILCLVHISTFMSWALWRWIISIYKKKTYVAMWINRWICGYKMKFKVHSAPKSNEARILIWANNKLLRICYKSNISLLQSGFRSP